MKKRNKKGFTLAELLIVIAIIAVLMAILFPVFGAQLDKAKTAAAAATVRANYSEFVADEMMKQDVGATITVKKTDINTNVDSEFKIGIGTNDEGLKTIIVQKGTDTNLKYEFPVDKDVTLSDFDTLS